MYELEIRKQWQAKPRGRRKVQFIEGFFMEVRHLLIEKYADEALRQLHRILKDLMEQ